MAMLLQRLGCLSAVVAILMSAAIPARADETEKQKLFLQLYDVMHYDRVLDQMSDSVGAQVAAALRRKYPDVTEEALKTVHDVLRESFADLAPQIVQFTGDFMVRNFTEEDIRNIIAFYRTPTGQKSLTVLPKMTQEMMKWLVPAMQRMQGDLAARLNERLKPQGYSL